MNITELVWQAPLAERHQLRTQLERTIADAERYRKLRAWFLKPKLKPSDADWMETWASSDEPDPHAFDLAVAALPEPLSLEQELIDGKKPSRGYESGRDT